MSNGHVVQKGSYRGFWGELSSARQPKPWGDLDEWRVKLWDFA